MERTRDVAKEVCGLCQGMTGAQIALLHGVLGRIAGRWSLCVLYTLAIAGGPLRFRAISERIGGISEKMLARTLKGLEKDGLIIRRPFEPKKVPPRVEYELTPLGREVVQATCPLWKWMFTSVGRFEDARQKIA